MSASCPTCSHLQPSGQTCGSPALRHEQLCYYHHPTRRPRAAGRKPRLPAFHLPNLADRASIQRALAKVVSRLIGRRLDRATARLILSGLQLVNQNLPGDHRPLGALIQRAQMALGNAPIEPLAQLLRRCRPTPSSAQKKRTKSETNPLLNNT